MTEKHVTLLQEAVEAETYGRRADAIHLYEEVVSTMQIKIKQTHDSREKYQLEQAIQECHERVRMLHSTPQRTSVSDHIDVMQTALSAQSTASNGIERAGGGKVMAGSAAAGAGLGLILAGPIGCILGAAGAAVMATRNGTGGELTRATGNLVAVSYEKAKVVNEEYHITDKLKQGAQVAVEKAKTLDEKYHIKEKATTAAKATLEKANTINQKYHVTDKVAQSAITGMKSLTKILSESSPKKQ